MSDQEKITSQKLYVNSDFFVVLTMKIEGFYGCYLN